MSIAKAIVDELRDDPDALAELRRLVTASAADPILLDVPKAARRLGKHPKTIERWCRDGRIEGARKVGATWRIPPDALDHVGARPEQSPTPQTSPVRQPNRQRRNRPRATLPLVPTTNGRGRR